ncbi:hypothetical protein BY996DRAFT_6813468 [Phakopsora pachyrhizi]|nr:hypothetical protein BY996DRAFT_6813468 [Phakopsora pachyrhizi]
MGIDEILSKSILPAPIKPKNPQNHPRMIKSAMLRSKLERSLESDRQSRISGTVRAKESKTITKKQSRSLDGTSKRERKERRDRSDRVVGKSLGGMIKLSQREIRMTMSQKNQVNSRRR